MNDDEKAIIDLTIAYTWALDDRRFEDLRDVFAADATGDLAGVHCEGLEAILERIQRGLGKLDATHRAPDAGDPLDRGQPGRRRPLSSGRGTLDRDRRRLRSGRRRGTSR